MEDKLGYSAVGIKRDGKRFIQYKHDKDKLPINTLAYTTIDFTEEQIKEIKNCTLEQLDIILSKYI